MTLRLLQVALWRKRGMVTLAVLAVAIGGSVAGALLRVRLARRLGIQPGQRLEARFDGDAGARTYAARVGAMLESGSADDEAWWIPLADAQALTGAAGRASLVQARLDDPARATATS